MNPIPGHRLWASVDLSTFLFLPIGHPGDSYYHRDFPAPYVHIQPYTPSFHRFVLAQVATLRLTQAGQAQLAQNHATLAAVRDYAALAFSAADLSSATPAVLPAPDCPHLLTALADFDPTISPHLYAIECPCSAENYFQLIRPSTCRQCHAKFPSGERTPRAELVARCANEIS
jgi:hypothetical protein